MTSLPGELLLLCCRGAQDALLAAPYIKADALAKVLAEIQPTANLTCVTRWNPHDIAVGASDAECRTLVLEAGGSFLLHPTLHAKYYRIDDTVLIGSANLTNPAMGWSQSPNLEILCHPSVNFDALGFEQRLLEDSREITESEFALWQSIEKTAVVSTASVLEGYPCLDDWRPRTREPRNLFLSYQGREEEIASSDEQRAARRDLEALLIPNGLSEEQFALWASTCLLSAQFASTVIQLQRDLDSTDLSRILAQTYGLSMRQARRDMETVQNWLRFFAPQVLQSDT